MSIAISVSGIPDADAEIRSLLRWLQREEDLPNPSLTPRATGQEDMGAVSDVLVVALSGTGAVLANSLSVWVRNRTTDLKVTFRGKKGTVQLDGKRIKDPVAVIEALREASGE
ncbi:effector-associated constant component EACC1 [Actinophytocola sediminis]